MLDQNFIVWLNDRSHGQVICHGSPGRFHYAFGIDIVVSRNRGLQRRIAVAVVPIDFEFFQVHWQFTEREGSDATGGEIERSEERRVGKECSSGGEAEY